jgi:hypothetical protein
VRSLIGYMPQAFSPHWDITARMLVEMGAARRPDLPPGAVRAALDEAGLAAAPTAPGRHCPAARRPGRCSPPSLSPIRLCSSPTSRARASTFAIASS